MRTGNTVYVVAGDAEHKRWWRNLRGGAPVVARIRGQTRAGQGEVLTLAHDPGAVIDGLTRYLRRFPAVARARHTRIASDGTPDAADVRAAARQAVMVRLTLAGQGQPGQTAGAGGQYGGAG